MVGKIAAFTPKGSGPNHIPVVSSGPNHIPVVSSGPNHIPVVILKNSLLDF